MDAKNIELSTVNPFFKQSSHLPPELQHYNTYLNGTLDSSFYQTPTSLRILRLGETNLTGHIDLPIHDLRNFKCIDIKEAYSLLPLNTTKLYHVDGELWLPGKVANLNYLLSVIFQFYSRPQSTEDAMHNCLTPDFRIGLFDCS